MKVNQHIGEAEQRIEAKIRCGTDISQYRFITEVDGSSNYGIWRRADKETENLHSGKAQRNREFDICRIQQYRYETERRDVCRINKHLNLVIIIQIPFYTLFRT